MIFPLQANPKRSQFLVLGQGQGQGQGCQKVNSPAFVQERPDCNSFYISHC